MGRNNLRFFRMKESVTATVANMEAVRTCRSCGVSVSKDAPFGHCPRCLLELGFVDAPAPEPKPKSPASKLRFGDYELIEQIGRGGMGVVYKARQVSLNRTVALKMVLDSHLASPVVLRRFLIEAEAAAKLDHPNIVPIYDIAEVEGQHFFSMRLIDGESLERKIALGRYEVPKRGKTRFAGRDKMQERIATLMATVARAVHYAHERGVLHRDLKPSNILIDKNEHPHLTDFGLAKISDQTLSLTPTTTVLGTPGYMAPEQALGGTSEASGDVYSVGVILYELLTGKLPFDGPTAMEIIRRTREEDPINPRRANPGVADDLVTVCLKCLEKDPAQRYVSAGALAEDLERWLRCEPIRAERASIVRRTTRWVQRNRAGTAVITSLLVGLVFTLISLQHAKRVEATKDLALANFNRAIGRQIDALGSTNSFYEITSEQFGYLQGKEPAKFSAPPKRFMIGIFIFSNPLETVLGYGQLFAAMELPLKTALKQPVRLDFRVYTEVNQAAEHLLTGRIDFLRVDAASAVRLCDRGDIEVLAQENARNDVAVIFTRADSGITNITQLKGYSIAFVETNSVVTATAKAQLLAAGLCARDINCTYLNGASDPQLAKPGYFESPDQGYFDRQCETVSQVIDNKAYTAGVAREEQFRLKRAGEWQTLARFRFPRHLWVRSPKISDALGESFKLSLVTGAPVHKEAARPEDGYGAGYEVRVGAPPPNILLHIRQILGAATAFDECGTNVAVTQIDTR